VAQLGARFHGMEEVVGSIPTRSTKSSNTRLRPLALLDRNSIDRRAISMRLAPPFGFDLLLLLVVATIIVVTHLSY
jgi:hypothetical protein